MTFWAEGAGGRMSPSASRESRGHGECGVQGEGEQKEVGP